MIRRVLVVDDDRLMVRTLCDILRLHGWDAHRAYSGEDAVGLVRASSYHVVLMDVRMGGINGVETMKTMREIRPGLRVILMTAYTAGELLAEAERGGAVHVLSKPVAVPALVRMLEDTVDEARRVLVVDDDPAFLATMSAAIRSHGFTTVEAENFSAAMEHLETGHPAVIVLDLHLGGVTPEDSVLAIRRVCPAAFLILCGGTPGALEATTTSVPGSWIHASLRKPFPPEQLVGLLDDIIPA
jgi:DNA-binding NtrC family response regulator